MSNTSIGALTGTAGGTNVPMADMSSAAAEISLVTRDAAGGPYRTVPLSAIPGLLTEFNFILTSRADLIAAVGAPVAGIFTLPSGSYFVKTSFSLNANEGIQINGGNVLIQGGGAAGKVLTGGSATIPLIQVIAGSLSLLTVGLTQAAVNGTVLDANGDVSFANACVFTVAANTTNACILTSGTGRLTLSSCRIVSQGPALRHSAAGQRLAVIGSRIESTLGTAIEHISANGYMTVEATIVRITGLGAAVGQCFFLNGAGATLEVDDCEVAMLGTGQVMVLLGAAGFGTVSLNGGEWQGSGAGVGTGIQVTQAITRGLIVDGVSVLNLATWILHTVGVVAAARCSHCNGHTGVTTMVNWGVASIPTRGLIELGNSWNAATPFLNHQQNDARVNRRSNQNNAGNISETGIVP